MISHNGLRDLFTNLASSQLLNEELKRELARAARKGEVISLVRFVLTPIHPSDDATSPAQRTSAFLSEPTAMWAREILHFGNSLSLLTRTEDTCARTGELEFLCSMNTTRFQVSEWVTRIHEHWLKAMANENRKGNRKESFPESTKPQLILKYSWIETGAIKLDTRPSGIEISNTNFSDTKEKVQETVQQGVQETVLTMLNRLDLQELSPVPPN